MNSELDQVLAHINALLIKLGDSVCGYLAANRDRMDYARYQKRGLLINSSAIESKRGTEAVEAK